VDQKLVPLLLAERSTARLCKVLNETFGKGGQATIHPNRLHALFSDDVSRGVNEATLGLVEQAIEAFQNGDGDWQRRSDKRLAELQAEVRHLRNARRLREEDILKRLALPPAVARHVLAMPLDDATLTAPLAAPPPQKARVPDWSYQETAIARTLEAFRRRPTSKVGLILPTGAGKTRTALRVVLETLAKAKASEGLVYWVTHRKNLRAQAHRELQKLLSKGADKVPEGAAALLASRIKFIMVSALPEILAGDATPPLLIVVDEAHHAAAPSYQPIFDSLHPVPALFLTATPNRMDGLPIGIDEIAFTITYRELEERGVIVMPKFVDFPVEDFEWSESQVRDLADYVIQECEGDFTKVLVLAPRIDRVEEFYGALMNALAQTEGHPLDPADIGFIHGSGNSLRTDNDDFLAIFAEKPRAILISAQLLLEGFDDPAIKTVLLTYPSASVVRLMQAAGRCVRYFPEKNAAYVVQARNDDLAYHFDQRWLYQEISDYLRPELIDINYGNAAELEQKAAELLDRHNVSDAVRKRIMSRLVGITPGETCRLLLYGLPYYGAADRFNDLATWGAFLESPKNSASFRGVFNSFCALGASLSDPSHFLAREGSRVGMTKNLAPGSTWAEMMEVLTASYFAREEMYGSNLIAKASRSSKRQGPTTWLRYVTFHFRPRLPQEFTDFLADCYNRSDVVAAYLDMPERYALAIKIPLPLGGHEAWMLPPVEAAAFEGCIGSVLKHLKEIAPAEQIGALASYLAGATERSVATRIFLRAEAFLGEDRYATRVHHFPHHHSSETEGELR
jgi:superfamily II DNA or RNA helicase